jgi:hypothetical protein
MRICRGIRALFGKFGAGGEDILCNADWVAEREGFYRRHFQQLVMIPTDSENTQCLRRVQAPSELPLQFL